MWILKANAYGHGLVPIARHLADLGALYIGVAYVEEGIELRQAGIKIPILIMGGIIKEQIPLFIDNDLTLTASSVAKLEIIQDTALKMNKKAVVHLKIDTGMERIGVHYYNASQLIETSNGCDHVLTEGIYTHLAKADDEDLSYSKLQLERWQIIIDRLPPDHNYTIHVANSGAILQIPQAHYDMVRCGLLLFGIYPSAHLTSIIQLRPALTLKTEVVYFKVVLPNHPVSYGGTWKSDKMKRVVTIPIGYGDGFMRSLSDKGKVIIGGKMYPIIGRICMDQLMVDIGWDSVYNGDEVILIGSGGNSKITVENLADWARTIPWEILTSINNRVPRIYNEVK